MAEFGPQTAAEVEASAQTGAAEVVQAPGRASSSDADARPAAPQATRQRTTYPDIDNRIAQLPPYARSILKIRVPVAVTLAATKQTIGRIVELGPGSIIQFDKPCEEALSLEVGNQEVALGEAVKVGGKFGLRITSMVMPAERFWTVRGKRAVGRAGNGSRRQE